MTNLERAPAVCVRPAKLANNLLQFTGKRAVKVNKLICFILKLRNSTCHLDFFKRRLIKKSTYTLSAQV
jgi:hypothetical protein